MADYELPPFDFGGINNSAVMNESQRFRNERWLSLHKDRKKLLAAQYNQESS
jgi:hypothetical protein